MRATSQDTDAAAMMGINVNRTISFTFALAGGLAGAGGLLYFIHFTSMRYDTGFQLGLIAFTAAVLGGIGNLAGAVLGAICIGLIEQFNEGLELYSPGSDWTCSIVFAILIAILVFRPEGLPRRAHAGGSMSETPERSRFGRGGEAVQTAAGSTSCRTACAASCSRAPSWSWRCSTRPCCRTSTTSRSSATSGRASAPP